MDTFLKKIQNEMDRREIQQKWLSSKMGVSPQSLNYYLKGTNKIKFFPFYILMINVFSDEKDIKEGLVSYINKTDNVENLKSCLEWSIQNGEIELFELALNKADKETSSVYSLLLLRRQNKISSKELFERAESLKLNQFKQKEIEVLLYIVSLYSLHDMKKFGGILLYADFVLKRVSTLKEGYLKDSFKIRVQELTAIALLKENSVDKAINFAKKIIEEGKDELFPLPIISMQNLLGEAYVFTDIKKSIEHNKKAIEMFENLKFKNQNYEYGLKATHDFIKITNNIFEGLYLIDKSEEAHLLAKQNDPKNKQKALEILNKLEENNALTAHQLYYRALATEDCKDFEISKKQFYKNEDYFYCQLTENPHI
ncbi:AimR family lysis-lysogeny pheromone receptor [Peribacillus castrilensis]|uniref:AimR family lysis-lysogeny pheromone receptor n=1 Tax=Peribacillus castrilensis TaxID=2897690 RepID=UPI003D2E0A55